DQPPRCRVRPRSERRISHEQPSAFDRVPPEDCSSDKEKLWLDAFGVADSVIFLLKVASIFVWVGLLRLAAYFRGTTIGKLNYENFSSDFQLPVRRPPSPRSHGTVYSRGLCSAARTRPDYL